MSPVQARALAELATHLAGVATQLQVLAAAALEAGPAVKVAGAAVGDQAVPQPRPTSAPAAAPTAVRALEVLRRLRRPVSPGELFAALGLSKYEGRPLVRRLAAEGLVVVTGMTRAARVSLPPAAKASSPGGRP